jgi:hypothetical protein
MAAEYLSRLFLLLLLAGDWAGDPYFGRSPLSRPMSSQDAFCHSLTFRDDICRAISFTQDGHCPTATAIDAVVSLHGSASLLDCKAAPALPQPAASLQALMSLRC